MGPIMVFRWLVTVVLLSLIMAVTSSRADPVTTVTAFNEALSANDLDAALTHIAEGGLQFNLHSAHADLASSEPPLTQDLTALWRVVATVLLSTQGGYQREVEIDAVKTEGNIATVWTRTRTITLRESADKPSTLSFSEMYLLLRRDGVWQIAAVANNRPPAEARQR